jgi:signal transduction histidine kinase
LPGRVPRLQRLDEARVEAMIGANLVQDLVVQAVLVCVGVWWFSNRWIWALWAIRWVVLVAIAAALVSVRRGRLTRALLLLGGGHVIGVVGLVAIVPVLTPLAMLILVGDLFLGSYLQEPARKRYFFAMIPIISGVAALSFQSGTNLADRTPRSVAITLIIAHTLSSGFFIPKGHRQHYVQLRLARDRLTASEVRLSAAVLAERASIASELEAEPVAGIRVLLAKLQRIRENLVIRPEVAAKLADEASFETQEALRSLRRISHGVYPELLQSGIHEALRQLVGGLGELERFDVPTTRLPANVEAAIYMAVRELIVREPLVFNRDRIAAHSLVIELDADRVHLFLRIDGVRNSLSGVLSSMPTDRIVAVGGEASLCVDDDGLEFLANIPLAVSPSRGFAAGDANRSILSVFTTWGLRAALVAMAVSAVVLVTTRDVSGVFVVLAFAWLAAGARLGAWFMKRGRYGSSIAALCLASLTSAVFATALVTELAPLMALVVSLPTMFALPFLDERRLDLIAVLQATSLSALTIIGYLNAPLIERVVSPIVPFIAVSLGAGAAAALISVTLIATVRTVTDASFAAVGALGRIVQAADAQRQSIERDLHDGAQQLFVAISLQFRSLVKVATTDSGRAQRVVDTTEGLLGEARIGLINVARGALVPELDEGRLADALHRGIGALRAGALDHEVKLRVDGVDAVPPELANAVYFCCHEALQNAMKHGSNGGRKLMVMLSVRRQGDWVSFSVSDDGVGFDPDSSGPSGSSGSGSSGSGEGAGHGLPSIAARIAELQGELSVVSSPGGGTVVAGAVPLIR